MRATDAKANHVPENFRRALTIHDGARLTPTMVAILGAISDAAEELAVDIVDEELAGITNPRSYHHRDARQEGRRIARPVLVARSDGLAVYTSRRLL